MIGHHPTHLCSLPCSIYLSEIYPVLPSMCPSALPAECWAWTLSCGRGDRSLILYKPRPPWSLLQENLCSSLTSCARSTVFTATVLSPDWIQTKLACEHVGGGLSIEPLWCIVSTLDSLIPFISTILFLYSSWYRLLELLTSQCPPSVLFPSLHPHLFSPLSALYSLHYPVPFPILSH